MVGAMMVVAIAMSCSPTPTRQQPGVAPGPGSYIRVYRINSNTWDLDDLAGSAFEASYESVDKDAGADLADIKFFATHRSGLTGFITNEVLVKTVTAADAGFAVVPEPTSSEYLRSGAIRITALETLTALNTLTTDPDGTTCTGIFPDVCTMVAFPGTLAVGDRIIFRLAITDKAGVNYTVQNPQTTVTPAQGNQKDANITANLAGGLFYANPMIYTMLIQRTLVIGAIPNVDNGNAYLGVYRMAQVARWQPDHSAAQLLSFPWIDEFAYGNSASDSTQIVTLTKVAGGLPTQRQFSCKYRGETISMMINLEMAVINQTGAGISGATLTTVQTAAPAGFGFPTLTTNANLGTVSIPLQNTGVNCTSELQYYSVTPQGGSFTGLATLPFGFPRVTVPNRGFYRIDRDGLAPGDVFTISVDDDADEYGHRKGYCNWYTRIMLTMTKL